MKKTFRKRRIFVQDNLIHSKPLGDQVRCKIRTAIRSSGNAQRSSFQDGRNDLNWQICQQLGNILIARKWARIRLACALTAFAQQCPIARRSLSNHLLIQSNRLGFITWWSLHARATCSASNCSSGLSGELFINLVCTLVGLHFV